MKQIIEKYKRHRKYKHLSRQYSHSYAFVGIGNHSLNNLYPVLDYLQVPLKYVVAMSQQTVNVVNNSSGKYNAVNDLQQVLEDDTVKGIFISASPENHYELAQQALTYKKNVFIEKPPCRNTTELEKLICLEKETVKEVVVGVQRRYAPTCMLLRKKLTHPLHYTYNYCTGSYPDGSDILTELFIHPIDLVTFLFGKAKLVSLLNTSETLLLQLLHDNGVIGSIELSTAYSWQMAEEKMTVIQKNGIFELTNLSELLYKKKPIMAGTIPLEKVISFTPVTEVLFNQNMFQPVIQHNNLYVNGFYSEVETFVSLCEQTKKVHNHSSLVTLKPTYELLDEIREKKTPKP